MKNDCNIKDNRFTLINKIKNHLSAWIFNVSKITSCKIKRVLGIIAINIYITTVIQVSYVRNLRTCVTCRLCSVYNDYKLSRQHNIQSLENVSIGDVIAQTGERPHAHLRYQCMSWVPAPSPWIPDARVYSVKERWTNMQHSEEVQAVHDMFICSDVDIYWLGHRGSVQTRTMFWLLGDQYT